MSLKINRGETASLTAEQEELFNRLADCYWDACDLGLRHTAELISDAENMVLRELRTRLKNIKDAEQSVIDLSEQLAVAKESLTRVEKVNPVIQKD